MAHWWCCLHKQDGTTRRHARHYVRALIIELHVGVCVYWTLYAMLDGCYTRMLRSVKQIHWERHVTNLELYGGLPRVSTKIRARRLRLAGHCLRHDELAASKLVLWAPTQGHCSRGRPQTTYVDTLCRDSGLRREELRTAMEDQRVWRAIIRCSASTEWMRALGDLICKGPTAQKQSKTVYHHQVPNNLRLCTIIRCKTI